MSETTSAHAASNLIPTNESSINRVCDGNMVDKANVVCKANLRPLEFGIEFFTSEARFVFTNLK